MKPGNRHQAGSNSKKVKVIRFALYAMLFALCGSTEAQLQKIPRIAYLGGGSADLEQVWLNAFLQGLGTGICRR